ncbi:MAG: phage holin family protein [Prolixibacteraceae bacterium]|nr:phage holin family protein [Prolixibacteraceae bacterium]
MFNFYQPSSQSSFGEIVTDWFVDFLVWLYRAFTDLVCSIFFAAIAYFFEVQGAIHVMWGAMAVDLVFGVSASVFRRGEKFCMKKFTVAVGRCLALTILVGLMYAIDKETSQDMASSYRIAAWFFSFWYVIGATKNMDELFGGKIFKAFNSFLNRQVQDRTGVDIQDPDHAVRRD